MPGCASLQVNYLVKQTDDTRDQFGLVYAPKETDQSLSICYPPQTPWQISRPRSYYEPTQ